MVQTYNLSLRCNNFDHLKDSVHIDINKKKGFKYFSLYHVNIAHN